MGCPIEVDRAHAGRRRPGQRGSEVVITCDDLERDISRSRRTGQIGTRGLTIGRAEPAVTTGLGSVALHNWALVSSPVIASTSIYVSRPVPPTPKDTVAVVLVVFAVNHHAHS